MKACVLSQWEHLEMQEQPLPVPGNGQARVRMLYAGVCGSDITVYLHHHLTASIPRILCHEMLGVIEEICSDQPTAFHVGDRVIVFPLRSCGKCDACQAGHFNVCRNLQIMGLHIDGGFVEQLAVDLDMLIPVPADMPDEVAILSEPFAVGVHANMRANTKPGDHVFVVGAGPIGIITGVCAKWFGAASVAISEVQEGRRAVARKFGLTTVDPINEDPVAIVNGQTDGVGCDVVFEASGSAAGGMVLADTCKIRGTVVLLGVPAKPVSYQSNKIVLKELSLLGMRVYSRKEFENAIRLLYNAWKAGEYAFGDLIDGRYTLDETECAILRQSHGETNGKLLVRMNG